jgi:acyl-CoA hydrolase
VTKSLDRLDFHHPIPVGALVTCYANVDYVGRSSMDISVQVYSETVSTGERQHTHTAHLVFVAIDRERKPVKVPRLVPTTDEERVRFDTARIRHEARKRG